MGQEIYLHEISKKFKNEDVLLSCTLRFEEGHIYGIIGRNGSGKTVLLKLMCGLYRPDSGYIEMLGKRVGEKGYFAENTGIMIENPGFLNGYTGYQNLKYLAQIQCRIGDDEIKKAMETVGLDWKNRKKVGKYSLGMRQRLGIAQAIMEDPKVLLLDEPMNALDEGGVKDMRALLLEKKREGKIIVLASHIKEDISILCDEVYEISHGKVEKSSIY